ncbi:MAG: hypothetical protein HY913_21845 [Desulfomonile tiedjei]|nr:hypothetical protein [Desulfomonile tiedjei]
MCMDGVCQAVMNDPKIQEMMSNPILDLIHKQVVMVLYSLDAGNQLETYREVLPVYLSKDWAVCSDLLDTIERAGLLKRSGNSLELTYSLPISDAAGSCECHA